MADGKKYWAWKRPDGKCESTREGIEHAVKVTYPKRRRGAIQIPRRKSQAATPSSKGATMKSVNAIPAAKIRTL